MRHIGEHAVVLGAGMAGLLAARVLAEAYERVTIIERDAMPPSGRRRKGVPQGRHTHVLLPRGQRALQELFPGIHEELIGGGAVVADSGAEHRLTLGGHTLRQRWSGDRAIQASRPFLEEYVRQRVAALAGVELTGQRDAVGLVTTDPTRVTGVQTMRRTPGSTVEELRADLVVDATGRAARTCRWLEHLGHDPVPTEEIKVGVAYATRPLRLPKDALADKTVLVGPRPGRPAGMALVAVEDGRHLLTLAGLDPGHRPPADPEGFLTRAAELAPPDVFDAVRAAEPLDGIATYRCPSDLRRRFERVRRLPSGLIVTGDAMCSFNPFYAQGMTVACLEAEALRRCLAAGPHALTRRFFQAAAKALDAPWQMAVAADLSMPEVPGRRTPAIRLINAYVRCIHATAAHDPDVAEQFVRVTGLLDPPTALLRPSILTRCLSSPPRSRTAEASPATSRRQ